MKEVVNNSSKEIDFSDPKSFAEYTKSMDNELLEWFCQTADISNIVIQQRIINSKNEKGEAIKKTINANNIEIFLGGISGNAYGSNAMKMQVAAVIGKKSLSLEEMVAIFVSQGKTRKELAEGFAQYGNLHAGNADGNNVHQGTMTAQHLMDNPLYEKAFVDAEKSFADSKKQSTQETKSELSPSA